MRRRRRRVYVGATVTAGQCSVMSHCDVTGARGDGRQVHAVLRCLPVSSFVELHVTKLGDNAFCYMWSLAPNRAVGTCHDREREGAREKGRGVDGGGRRRRVCGGGQQHIHDMRVYEAELYR